MTHPSPPTERNSLLRLFGSPRQLLTKADSDLTRLADALRRQRQTEALWALMDCSITVFHVGDWVRATRTEHHVETGDLIKSSRWIRMTRDICHAAKHGDLTWKKEAADVHGPVLSTLAYRISKRDPEMPHRIVAILLTRSEQDVLVVLRKAIDEWSGFLASRGL